jgi:microcystin-dependent protein
MGSPFVGEIRVVGFNFAPVGWAMCDGQVMAIAESEALFNLIGTTYGGDGETTFQLPNLQSRVPVQQGTGVTGTQYVIGELAGVESVALSAAQIPSHSHTLEAVGAVGSQSAPGQALLAGGAVQQTYSPQTPASPMAGGAVQLAGNSLAHVNIQPSLALNYIISLFGIFPSQ